MKELTQYQCETCGTLYAQEESCLACEASHIPYTAITSCRYQSIKQGNSKYPYAIHILMDDGTTLVFKR